jgi:hypothetical protein
MVYTQDGTIASQRDLINTARGQNQAPYCPHGQCFEYDNKRWLMRNNDHRRLARVNCTQLNTDSMPGNYLQVNDTYFDIQITGAPVHTLENLVLHLTVVNQSATLAVVALLPFWFFNRIECMANGGFTDDTIYPFSWYQHFVTTNSLEKKTNMSPSVWMQTGSFADQGAATTAKALYDESTQSIATGATRQYYIPFDCNFLVQSNAWLKSKSVNPRFRFYGSSNPQQSTSPALATNVMLLNGAELIVCGIIYMPTLADKINTYYQSGNTLTRICLHERQIFDLSSWSPGVETSDQSLTAFNGEYAGMWIYFSRAQASREQLYASQTTATPTTVGWLPITDLSLKDSSGNPVMFLKMGAELLQNIFPAAQYPESAMQAYKALYYFPFTRSGSSADVYGLSGGGIRFDAKFQLQATPAAYTTSLADVAWKQTIHAQRFGILCLTDQGEFKITKL